MQILQKAYGAQRDPLRRQTFCKDVRQPYGQGQKSQAARSKKNKAKDTKKAAKPKRGGRIVRFFRDMGSELKKATWPTKQELAKYTGIVLLFICAFAVVVGLIDLGLTKLLALIVG